MLGRNLGNRNPGASLQTEKGLCYGPASVLLPVCLQRVQGVPRCLSGTRWNGWSHRLAWPRTEPSQGLNTGSNPVGTTTLILLMF